MIVGVLLVISIFCAIRSQRRSEYNEETCKLEYTSFRKYYFFLSFIILASVCFFCKSGVDIKNYVEFYNSWTIDDFADLSFEIGDRVLFVFLHSFISDPYIGLGVIKVISIGLVYKALYIMRKQIHIGLAIFSYIALLYMFNFHLLRMMLALGIVFLAFALEVEGKSKKCVCLLALAFLFHYSSILVLMIYLLYKILGNKLSLPKLIVLMIVFLLVYGNLQRIVGYLTSSLQVFGKYDRYTSETTSGTGIVQIVLFIPVIYILMQGYRESKDDIIYRIGLFLGLMTFFSGSMGYIFPVISRTVYYFYFFFVSYCSSTPLKMYDKRFVLGQWSINFSTVCLILDIFLRAYIYYIMGDGFVSNGLQEYLFIWS